MDAVTVRNQNIFQAGSVVISVNEVIFNSYYSHTDYTARQMIHDFIH